MTTDAAPTLATDMHAQRRIAAIHSPVGLAVYASRGVYQLAPHLRYLNRRLLDLANRDGVRNVIVEMPPRHGKSETISKYFAAWYLSSFQEHRAILSSYEADFAATWGAACRNIIEEYGPDLFNVTVDTSSRSRARWNLQGSDGTARDGGMQTAGVGGALTGKGANLLIIDDPIKNHREALSKDRRNDVWNWWQTTASTRRETHLASGLDPITLLVMTRWHEDDLAGRLLENEPDDWERISFPLIATGPDAIGRKRGDVLWPPRVGAAEAKRIKQTSTPFWFGALYQQTPKPEDGNIIERTWFRYFDQHPNRDLFDAQGWPLDTLAKNGRQSWDMAFKDTDGSDYVVGGAWLRHGADRFLVDVSRDKRSFTKTCDEVRRFDKLHRMLKSVLVEDKANGPAVINTLGRIVSGLTPFDPGKHGSKAARLHSVAPAFRSGNVWIPRPTVPMRHDPPITDGVAIARAHWVEDYVEELVSFPNDPHDDQVDMTTQALLDMEAKQKRNVGSG